MRSLHHIALGAVDVESLAAFYKAQLGLPETTRHEDEGGLRSVWLDAGGTLLMIEACARSDRGSTGGKPGVEPGWFLLAFQTSPEERAALERRLAAAGHPREDATGYTSYFRDPEGNRFALSHYPERG